jgi:penicillin amidase
VLEAPRPPWLTDTDERDRYLRAAATRALTWLSAELGGEPQQWRWGALHTLAIDHVLAPVPALGRAFSRGPFAYGGDVNTVSQGGFSVYRGPASGGFSPAYRQVIDLAEPDRSTFALPGGNSGIPGHPRYDDALGGFLAGRQRPLLYTHAAVERHAQHRLLLLPTAGE